MESQKSAAAERIFKEYFCRALFLYSLIVIQFQHTHKCFLWNFHISHLAHPLLSFLLFLQKFLLPRNIAAVTFCQHIFSQRFYRSPWQ